MEVPTYIFQSPYPSAIQVGRPNPQAQTSSDSTGAVDALSQTDKKTNENSEPYVSQQNSGSSVNVAVSSTDTAVSSSLDTFSSLSSLDKATEAYES